MVREKFARVCVCSYTQATLTHSILNVLNCMLPACRSNLAKVSGTIKRGLAGPLYDTPIIKSRHTKGDCNLNGHINFWAILMMSICWTKTYMLQIQARGLLFASKKVGLEVNSETIKCMFTYREEQRTKSEHKDGYVMNPNFQEYQTLSDQNCVHEDIKSSLRSRNACYRAVQGPLSSRLLFKSTKLKMHIIIKAACFCADKQTLWSK